MNKYLTLLAKRAERAYLSARIVLERPDLIAKPFGKQLGTYIQETLEQHLAINEAPQLPKLLDDALGYDAHESAGHYRALYFFYLQKSLQLEFAENDHSFEMSELVIDNIGLRKVAREAVDIATNAVGQTARSN